VIRDDDADRERCIGDRGIELVLLCKDRRGHHRPDCSLQHRDDERETARADGEAEGVNERRCGRELPGEPDADGAPCICAHAQAELQPDREQCERRQRCAKEMQYTLEPVRPAAEAPGCNAHEAGDERREQHDAPHKCRGMSAVATVPGRHDHAARRERNEAAELVRDDCQRQCLDAAQRFDEWVADKRGVAETSDERDCAGARA